MSHIALFEDPQVNNFLPLTWTHPIWELRCGIWTLQQAIEIAYGRRAEHFFVRDFLATVTHERTGQPVNQPLVADEMYLLLNGRLLATQDMPYRLPIGGETRRFVSPDGALLGAWVKGQVVNQGWEYLEHLPAQEIQWPLLQWWWELFQNNSTRIDLQANQAWPLGLSSSPKGVHLLHPEQIFIHPTARVMPGVVLDGTDGPIVIDAKATIMPNAVIQGPSYVGERSTVKIGAKIYHGTTIGPICKVGGEVEETIFHSYSNKQHDGFLGHAYVGSWCNFGADTNNSDLKNNYRPISAWVNGHYQNTNSLFIGLCMGDHAKTGINSTLNTGTVVGTCCNIFGGGLPPKYIPPFSWGGADGMVPYQLERALDTAERVMARRQIALTPAEEELLRYVFAQTVEERADES